MTNIVVHTDDGFKVEMTEDKEKLLITLFGGEYYQDVVVENAEHSQRGVFTQGDQTIKMSMEQIGNFVKFLMLQAEATKEQEQV